MTIDPSSAGGAPAPRTVLDEPTGPGGRGRGARGRVVASLAALGVVGLVGGFATYSAFTSTASNDNNSFATGSLRIDDSDDDVPATQAMFSLPNMKPGDSVEKCIAVANTGSLPISSVQLSLAKFTPTATGFTTQADTLDGVLELKIERSAPAAGYTFAQGDNTATGFACDGRFTAAGATTLGTTGVLSGRYGDVGTADATGWGTPNGGSVKVYRFTASIPAGAGDAAQTRKGGFSASWAATQ